MSDTSNNIYVSAGSFDSPFYDFYTDASGTQELTPISTLYLDASYTFHRLNGATTHPFYISDVSYEEPHSSNILLTGDGSYNTGITGSETFTLEFTGLDTSDNLYYYCTSHSSMVNAFTLIETTPVVDTTAPTLSSIIPLLDASNVTIDSNLAFTFSEDVSGNFGNITIYDNSDNVVEIIDVSGANVSILNDEVTVNPVSDLSYNTTYYVNIDSGAFEDSTGNAFTGLDSSSNSGMRFTTEVDVYSPILSSVRPILNATDISINTDLEFNFNEDISVNSGNITLYDSSGNTIIQVFDVSSSDVLVSGSQVTISLQTDLSFDTSYYVNIDSDTFQDALGNTFTGLDSSSNSGMRFTTAIDYTGPVIIGILPLLNATDISVNSNLEFTFDEDISANIGSIFVLNDADNSIVEQIDVSSENVTISGNTVIVNPSTDLPFGQVLYVNIDNGAFQDEFSNNFIGLNSNEINSGVRFTTEHDVTSPTLISISPVLDTIDVSINSNLIFTFSENVGDASGNIYIYDSSTNELLNSFDVTGSNVSFSGSQVTVNPGTDLSFNRSFYVNIDTDAIQDEVGNKFVGLDSSANNTGMRFTTEPDVTLPIVTNFTPILNTTNVSISSNLTFTFSEDIVLGSGNVSIHRVSDNNIVKTIDVSSPEVSIAGNSVTINPSTDLPYNTFLYINIDSGAFQDLRGNDFNGLDSSYLDTGVRFTTELDIIAPSIVGISPILDVIDISLNSNLEFTFSEDISVGTGNITIYRESNDVILQVIDARGPNVYITGRELVVNPPRDLPPDLSVYVNIDAGAIKDEPGNKFIGLTSSSPGTGMRFTTVSSISEADITSPTLSNVSPALNSTKIRLDTTLIFTFSKDVLAVTGNIVIYKSIDNAVLQTIDVNNSCVTIIGNQVTVVPPAYLPENTSVYVNIDSNALLDSAGNNFGGLDSSPSDTGMRFTTIDPTTTRLFDIIKFCQNKKCQQNIDYKNLKTGGNDPSVSSAMRYSQYVRGNGSRR